MTKLASALGKQYQDNREKIFTRKFDFGGHTFKVRVPYVHETDEIYKRINNPDENEVETAYLELRASINELESTSEDFVFTDEDVIVAGRSLRESAKLKIQTEIRITEFVKLLIPEIPGESLADLTYKEISEEFPASVQMQLVEKIAEAISPTYKETRGN